MRTFLEKTTMSSVDWVEQTVLPNVGSSHIHRRQNGPVKGSFPMWLLSWDTGLFLPLDLTWNLGSPWVSSCHTRTIPSALLGLADLPTADLRLLSLHIFTWAHHTVAQSCLIIAAPRTLACQAPLCPWDFPGKNTGVSCHFLLQGIFPTQGLKLHLPHLLYFGWILYHWATGEAHVSHAFIINPCTFSRI